MTLPTETLPARQRILLTAHDLFYREGVRATGIDRIIKQSGVTKVTFYRHFPSKNALILAFLDYRHAQWLAWFQQALAKQMQLHGDVFTALPGCLAEWFGDPHFRGCAFINTAVELADLLPESLTIAHGHKADMAQALACYLPANAHRQPRAATLAMLIDGAIVKVQIDQQAEEALQALGEALRALALAWHEE
ncbi:TetR family transcriptional regulator [Gibbsiella quercinecans]|uniref:TetR family transcriptional regulator n=1 Tax=Gibbsiella quercinecans TaxID=929813 RepID=A0A250AX67_9GAMM|nr:TetR/AcrR family transcriptional regulator [Gibbsiella quercinecans]ATA18560.1 TetR family transcriptional regulator [Gibbsiella quercinecans]RLM04320.1 TetR family transcriptional regulator [Gibbsiella quercinecans]TCT82382.1 TetR family transcriptional regulator [Gibbsiella quercinecans]